MHRFHLLAASRPKQWCVPVVCPLSLDYSPSLFCSVLRTSCSWRQQLVDSTPLLQIAMTTTLDCLGPWTFGRHRALPQVMRAEQNDVDPNVFLRRGPSPYKVVGEMKQSYDSSSSSIRRSKKKTKKNVFNLKLSHSFSELGAVSFLLPFPF